MREKKSRGSRMWLRSSHSTRTSPLRINHHRPWQPPARDEPDDPPALKRKKK